MKEEESVATSEKMDPGKPTEFQHDENEDDQNVTGNEVVLQKKPIQLYIHVPSGSSELPMVKGAKIYQLVP